MILFPDNFIFGAWKRRYGKKTGNNELTSADFSFVTFKHKDSSMGSFKRTNIPLKPNGLEF